MGLFGGECCGSLDVSYGINIEVARGQTRTSGSTVLEPSLAWISVVTSYRVNDWPNKNVAVQPQHYATSGLKFNTDGDGKVGGKLDCEKG